MWLVERLRDRELRAFALEPCGEPRHEIHRDERRIAGDGDDERAARGRHSRVQSGERTGEAADGIGHHRITHRAVALRILVGVDQHVADLRGEAREHVRDHRLAVQLDQPLVDSAHPAPQAAGQDDARDVVARDQRSLRKRSPPVKSRKCLLVARPIIVIPTFSAISKPICVSPERETRNGMPICAALMTISDVRRPVV